MNHNICRECETVAHCSKHGCIPYVEGSLRPAIDQKVRETLDLLDGPTVTNGDGWSSTMTMVAVMCSIGGMSAGWILAMAFDAAGLR